MLSPPTFEWINGSPELQDKDEFLRIQLKLRGLANLKYFDDPISQTILGSKYTSPIGFGAFPHQGMAHKDAELGSAMAAADLGQLYVLSSHSNKSIEEIVKATNGKGSMMFELDVRLPEAVRVDLIQRVAQHQCFKGIVINGQYISGRVTENEWKNDFALLPHLECGTLKKYKDTYGNSHLLRDSYGLVDTTRFESQSFDLKQTVSQIKNVRGDLKVVLKGIMCYEDGLEAMGAGCDAIWVSNGGHLKAKSAPSTISVLPGIVQGVRAKYSHAEIFVDSGITRGTDVLKCLAFGANAVFVSRPIMWGIHMNGYQGCHEEMTMLNEELKLCMALTHCFKLSMVTEKQVIHMIKPRL